MWNEPSPYELSKIPGLLTAREIPWPEKFIYVHFFIGGCDWFGAEYDQNDRLFYGYAILNNDLPNSEWGYFSYDELRSIKVRSLFEVDRDLHWQIRKAGEVERIVQGIKESRGY